MKNKLIPFTFFLDILGFGNKVGRINNQEEADSFIEFMESNKSIYNFFTDLDTTNASKSQSFKITNYYEFKFAFISDSIILSFFPKEITTSISEIEYFNHSASSFYIMVNRIVALMFNLLSKHKILLRGAVSNKFSFIKNEFIVGAGIIEAYKLESEFAIYPRILLSNEISNNEKFMQSLKLISKIMYSNYRIVKRDKDNSFFIDYLSFLNGQANMTTSLKPPSYDFQSKIKNEVFFQLHKESIEDMKIFLESTKGSSEYNNIEKKFNWIKQYHNNNVSANYKINSY